MKRGLTFWHGFIVYWALSSLRMDLMGKEAFLAWADAKWIDASVTVPLAILALIFVVWHSTTRRLK